MTTHNPTLTSPAVRECIACACEKIDVGGRPYDDRGRSPYDGFGRLDLARLIEPALAHPEKILRNS